MSIYDEITTAKDLVFEVKAHGLSTAQDDICRAQDIFGNSPIEDLVDLANNVGRLNAEGKPDPNGSWSGGHETRSTFYAIAFHIWNWEDATRFWNTHSNPEHTELKQTRETVKSQTAELTQYHHNENQLITERDEANARFADEQTRTANAEARALAAEKAIIELKAKLYDLMMKQEGK